jgi:hypothetical protein
MVDHESSRTNEGEEHSIRVLTFGRLLEAIASNEGIAQKARADICSGVRSLCHALGLLIESTPADPRIIAERLSGLTPVAARMSPAAFGTAAAIWIGRLSTRIIVSAAVETSGRWLPSMRSSSSYSPTDGRGGNCAAFSISPPSRLSRRRTLTTRFSTSSSAI